MAPPLMPRPTHAETVEILRDAAAQLIGYFATTPEWDLLRRYGLASQIAQIITLFDIVTCTAYDQPASVVATQWLAIANTLHRQLGERLAQRATRG